MIIKKGASASFLASFKASALRISARVNVLTPRLEEIGRREGAREKEVKVRKERGEWK
jgi:hypothetical protein